MAGDIILYGIVSLRDAVRGFRGVVRDHPLCEVRDRLHGENHARGEVHGHRLLCEDAQPALRILPV